MATNSTHVLPIHSSGMATNSTHVTHEVLAGAVSKQLVLYNKGAGKKFVVRNLFLPPMGGFHLGTQVQF